MMMAKRLLSGGVLAAVLAVTISQPALAGEPTAFQLIKEGNRYVGEQAKDKVVQIRSEKSIGSLTPSIWYVVYYEPDATFKATEVKFGAGKKLKVSRPLRILEMMGKDSKMLDRAKLKVDSDKAIKKATAEPLLKPLTLKATQLFLQHSDAGPEWKVLVWAAKLKQPNEDVNVGYVCLSAETGNITRTELHINSVD